MLAPVAPSELQRLRALCQEAGYTDRGLLALFGPIELPTRAGRGMAHFVHLTREGRKLDILVRLFLLGLPTPHQVAAEALGARLLEDCGAWGLLEPHHDRVAARVRLLPYRDLLLAADQAEYPEIAERPDQVMGITASTVALANFAVRRPVEEALDLGTGCRVQALLAAVHSRQVTATDTNGRALEFARFNAALNNRTNICFIQGDAFQPVRGRRFDLILSNPPFAISPRLRYFYRDSGQPGDSFCRRLVREAPEFLNDGGLFQMTLDWVEHVGQDWRQRLAEWFEGTGCDAWVLRLNCETAANYAYLWIRDTEPGDSEQTARLYEEWVEYFEREAVEAVSTGLIAMRRTGAARHWLRLEEAPARIIGPIGDWVAQGFLLRDFLEANSDEQLLTAKLRLVPEARLEQEFAAREGRWQSVASRIRLTRGLPWTGNLDARLAGSLARLAGQRPLRDVLVHLAIELGVEPDRVIAASLPLVRDMILRGFLLPESVPAVSPGEQPPLP